MIYFGWLSLVSLAPLATKTKRKKQFKKNQASNNHHWFIQSLRFMGPMFQRILPNWRYIIAFLYYLFLFSWILKDRNYLISNGWIMFRNWVTKSKIVKKLVFYYWFKNKTKYNFGTGCRCGRLADEPRASKQRQAKNW